MILLVATLIFIAGTMLGNKIGEHLTNNRNKETIDFLSKRLDINLKKQIACAGVCDHLIQERDHYQVAAYTAYGDIERHNKSIDRSNYILAVTNITGDCR